MTRSARSGLLPLVVVLLCSAPPSPPAQAACTIDRTPSDPAAPFTRHLGPDCSEQERQAQAVSSADLLAALKAGRGLDLTGVVVAGNLMLDQLPVIPVSRVDGLSPGLQRAVRDRGLKELRVIAGPVSIRRSVVRGAIQTNLQDGLLLFKGPVTMAGTTFEQPVDLSHSGFLGPVDGSEAVFLRQSFFLNSVFAQPVRFEKTAFGVHARFHRAVFEEPVTFHRAGFNGLAEFLEVTFEKDARFSQTHFKMGTGFSGSQFRGALDFSEALFEREAFFLFTRFEKDAYFRRATFRATADFSDARFNGVDDFSKTFFNDQPRFTRTKANREGAPPLGLQNPRIFYGVTAALGIFTLFFVWALRKRS
ncbi:MAG: pentapeptide repeat-containing protein [Nitrospirota bacterium]